ncbi:MULTISPECIES: IclR family transcriptional regulator [Rhizobium/Agrobacterium group]|uniref:IclR family transcriptional regulator n=1 Tax=Rhizobium/Agrobacterium group TaxID=227290 RepID=UPI00046EFBE8|nr:MULTISPECIES: IclR family transcriptional regulator [Rhizobium/Agrobacterium group]KQY53554.1 IclR family transcriptional regulator [Rhizobium sp. Root491]MDR5007959.1 IclR family transcriptional regulator [Agrobacterium tumefaciens]NSY57789.1 IclR family transcriptional regulator [Agrobacterium tumefaciens]UXR90443.1 IclR family transcriptional regulator [Agrobacterium tumefaciens]
MSRQMTVDVAMLDHKNPNDSEHEVVPALDRKKESVTGTLGKAVSLLELIALAEKPMRFTDVVEACGQPRGTVHRQLAHLVAEGLVDHVADQTYVVGLRLLQLAAKAWSSNDLRSVAAPHLAALQEATQESVHLAVLNGGQVTYLDKMEGKHTLRMHSQVGKTSPAYCTGVGKAALSMLSPDDLAALAAELDFHRFTQNTIVTPQMLGQDVAAIRSNGYGFDLQEHEIGIHCVAAPVMAPGRNFLAAISVTGPAYRVDVEQLRKWGPLVRETADQISAELACRLSPVANG